jgi:hypothetical protein
MRSTCIHLAVFRSREGNRTPRPRLRPVDRAFRVVLSRVWSRWVDSLAIVKPSTVIAWHRRGFARFWACKSRPLGRPPGARELVDLIERMARDNPLWSRRSASTGHRDICSATRGIGGMVRELALAGPRIGYVSREEATDGITRARA